MFYKKSRLLQIYFNFYYDLISFNIYLFFLSCIIWKSKKNEFSLLVYSPWKMLLHFHFLSFDNSSKHIYVYRFRFIIYIFSFSFFISFYFIILSKIFFIYLFLFVVDLFN